MTEDKDMKQTYFPHFDTHSHQVFTCVLFLTFNTFKISFVENPAAFISTALYFVSTE